MQYQTTGYWDEELWSMAKPVYLQAFGESGKPEQIVRRMFEKQICNLHVLLLGKEAVAMALTGSLKGSRALILDYLAVEKGHRGGGIGKLLLGDIRQWAMGRFDRIIIEVEAEQTVENRQRIRFWERCNFILTPYVHQYIWVPEPYRAMYMDLVPGLGNPQDGKALFREIRRFHGSAYRGQGSGT